MTRKLYYDDPRTLEFEAAEGVVVEGGGRRGVRLAATYFYPTSGGQPHDLGALGGARVVEVTDDDEGVTHWLEGDPGPAPWKARIDAARRLDHMQQHTGQHVLSQAFVRALRAPTVSFHLGADSATIDVELRDAAGIGGAEALANRILAEGRAVRAYEVDLMPTTSSSRYEQNSAFIESAAVAGARLAVEIAAPRNRAAQ